MKDRNFESIEEEEDTIDIFRYLAFDLMINNECMGGCDQCNQGILRFHCNEQNFLILNCDRCHAVKQIWNIFV